MATEDVVEVKDLVEYTGASVDCSEVAGISLVSNKGVVADAVDIDKKCNNY